MSSKHLSILLLSGIMGCGLVSYASAQTNQVAVGISESRSTDPAAHSREEVRRVQSALAGRGLDPGPVDGLMGQKTRKAIVEFQRQQNLHISGEIDDATRAALGLTTENSPVADRQTAGSPELGQHPGGQRGRLPDQFPIDPPSINTTADNQSVSSISRPVSPIKNNADVKDVPAQPVKPAGLDPNWDLSPTERVEQQKTAETLPPPDQIPDRLPADAVPAPNAGPNRNIRAESRDRLVKASEILQNMMEARGDAIPPELLGHVEAVAVIPHLSARQGVISRRLSDGQWSMPAFFSISGERLSSGDLVVFFTNTQTLSHLENEMSARLEAATGDFKRGVQAYSVSQELVSRIDLNGAVMQIDKEAGQNLSGAKATRIWSPASATAEPEVRSFVDALNRIVGKPKTR